VSGAEQGQAGIVAAAGPDQGGASLIAASLGSLPGVLTQSDRLVATSATETYALIARGAQRCWFGRGALRDSHIFHADAAPDSQGGRASIDIHERDPGAENPRGVKAYRIAIAPTAAGGASIEQDNLRFGEAAGQALRRDVARWANGDLACGNDPALEALRRPAPPAETASLPVASSRGARGKAAKR
jgi:hypothetical protein